MVFFNALMWEMVGKALLWLFVENDEGLTTQNLAVRGNTFSGSKLLTSAAASLIASITPLL